MTNGTKLQFSASGRAAGDEDEIILTSVGIDIGSSTTHLVFSRLRMKRRDSRYVVEERTVLHESAILLTPFVAGDQIRIDGDALGRFINAEYARSGVDRADVDTGALILTGLAVRRENARQIGELFADEAGKFVMVTAGDGLEATMAAHGSGSAAHSLESGTCLNVDIGGGTTKFALCERGRVLAVTAIDVGARLVVVDPEGIVTRVEPAASYLAQQRGLHIAVGESLSPDVRDELVAAMTEVVFDVGMSRPVDEVTAALFRLRQLPSLPEPPGSVIFSGGVSEYLYGRETNSFGDLGGFLASAVRARFERGGLQIVSKGSGIRATAMGASQYTIQLSGSTIFVDPVEVLPLRNVPVVALAVDLSAERLDPVPIAEGVRAGLERAAGVADSDQPVAIAVRWQGSATYARLDALTSGIINGLDRRLSGGGVPLVLVSEGDIGGLMGMHVRESGRLANPIVSIDGVELTDFDYIDVGLLIPSSGAAPIVIKSLVFPVPADDEFRLDAELV